MLLQSNMGVAWLTDKANTESTRTSGTCDTYLAVWACCSLHGEKQTFGTDRFHAQRFYALNCLTTRDAGATPIRADITLNMMLIEMPVAKAEDFYQHVQVQSLAFCLHLAWDSSRLVAVMFALADPVYYICVACSNLPIHVCQHDICPAFQLGKHPHCAIKLACAVVKNM